MGRMLVPVLVPVSCLDPALYAHQFWDFSSNTQMQTQPCQVPFALGLQAHSQPQQEMASLRQFIGHDGEGHAHTLHIEWYADSQRLYGNDRSIVSPAIEIPPEVLGEEKTTVFKLMLRSRGKGFSKSQGSGHIMLRCERSLRDPIEGSFSFKVVVGEETYGPVSHD